MDTTISLTPEQLDAIQQGHPVRLSPPAMSEDVIVIRATTFAQLQELLANEREKAAWAALGLEAAAQWAKENPY